MTDSRNTTRRFPALLLVLLTCISVNAQQEPIAVSVGDVMARPGDDVLVAVVVSGVNGRPILAGDVGVRFDASILPTADIVRRGGLLQDQSWLTASDVTQSGDLHTTRFVFAGASGFSQDGDLFYVSFQVPEDISLGTTTQIELVSATFNEGVPGAVLTAGTLRIVEEVLQAGFVARPLSGEAPLAVRFVDRSVGTVASQLWDFGDGATSAERQPTHVYSTAGAFSVTLTVTGPSGTSVLERPNYIDIAPDETPPAIAGLRSTGVSQNSATLVWSTRESSDSQVEYATTDDFTDAVAVADADLVTRHAVELTDLRRSTRYFYRVRSADAAGNTSNWRRGVLFTRRQPDRQPPVATRRPAAVELSDRGARIAWSTNEAATSTVDVTPVTDGGTALRFASEELAQAHNIDVSGLDAGTSYRFEARSIDAEGNESALGTGDFVTLAAPDVTAPVLLLGPVAIARTDRSATIKLHSSEPVSVRIDYGTGTEYDRVESVEARAAAHQVSLTDLAPNTLYHYQVEVTDAAGIVTASEDGEFVTRSDADTELPRFTVRPHATGRFARSLVIDVESDEPTSAIVEYGSDATFGQVAESAAVGRQHTIMLTDLAERQSVSYRVSLTDASGNGPALSPVLVDRTVSKAVEQAPLKILQGPIVSRRDHDRVTVAWRTSRPADSVVDFVDGQGMARQARVSEPTTAHEVILSGLAAGTAYEVSVSSTDAVGNTALRAGLTATTRAVPDTDAPFFVQSPQVVSVGEATAYIRWATNEPTDAIADFGESLGYGQSVFVEDFATAHTVALTGLIPGTTYHARVRSSDAAGNDPATSTDLTFTTRATADGRPPAFISGPGVIDATSTTATVAWRTDEPADSFVDFGESAALGRSAGSAELVQRHEVTLTDLEPGREYHFVVRSADPAGNSVSTDPGGSEAWSRVHTARTTVSVDDEPPRILRGPALVVGNQGAVIEFDSDEPCAARLSYGTPTTLDTPGEEVVSERGSSRRHSLRIARLRPATRYLFRLECEDVAGNRLEVGAPRRGSAKTVLAGNDVDLGALEFTTELTEDADVPVITAGPTVVSRTADAAIIEWTTDEPGDSFVDFGAEQLDTTVGETAFVQQHRVFLTGLTAGTEYEFRVRSTDFAGNGAVLGSTQRFTTTTAPDLTAPSVTQAPQVVYVDHDQAIITWMTDEVTSSIVDYGLSLPDRVVFDDAFVKEHTAHLTGLAPGSVYRVHVTATDPSNNSGQSDVVEFVTPVAAGIVLPRIDGASATSVGSESAIVEWQTDVTANRFVYFGVGDSLDQSVGGTDYRSDHRVHLTNLEPGTTYTYALESVNPAGTSSGRSAQATFTTLAQPDATPPAAPEGFAAVIGIDTARLTWSASSAADLASYALYRRINSGPATPVVTGLADTAYLDEGLTFGSTLSYYITAIDVHGNESAPSVEQGGSVSIRNAPSSIVPLGANTSGASTTLSVSNAVAAARGGSLTYTFHVSTSEGFEDVVASATGIGQGSGRTEWTFSKALEPGREYFWRARAADDVFAGPWSFPSFFVAVGGTTGDFDGNGAVDFDDFFSFVDAFGVTDGDARFDARFDLVSNGGIDFDDFFLFVDLFGTAGSARAAGLAGDELQMNDVQVTSFLQGAETIVDISLPHAVAGAGLRLGYNASEVDLVDASAADGLLAASTAVGGLQARFDVSPGEVTLLAHRLDGGSSRHLWRLRLKSRGGVSSTRLQIRTLATTGSGDERIRRGNHVSSISLLPDRLALHTGYPNPFNPSTTIPFQLPQDTRIRLAVFDLLGQRVRTLLNEDRSAGSYRVIWDARDDSGIAVASGAYFVVLETPSRRHVTRVTLLR